MASTAALAVEPDEILNDPALEARARADLPGLRCLVCQNQSIDDSNAPLARDLRLLVRERLKAGDSDAQVLRFVEDRYGEFVLLNPPLRGAPCCCGWRRCCAARGRVDDGARLAPPPAAGGQRDTGAAVGGRGGQAAVDPRRERGRAAGARLARLASAPDAEVGTERDSILPVTIWLSPVEHGQQRMRCQPRHRHA